MKLGVIRICGGTSEAAGLGAGPGGAITGEVFPVFESGFTNEAMVTRAPP